MPCLLLWVGWLRGQYVGSPAISLGSLYSSGNFRIFFPCRGCIERTMRGAAFKWCLLGTHTDTAPPVLFPIILCLSALPVITTATGLTSGMFLLEASAVNAYLLYLAHNFKGNRSNANARKVFLCTLWYLPLLLTAYVIHSKQWATQADRDEATNDNVATHVGRRQAGIKTKARARARARVRH